MAKPDKLRIPYEDHEYGRFGFVGRLPDGTQFMGYLTGAFPTGQEYYLGDDWRYKKKWLAVIHRFDADGNHIRSESRLGGFDIEGQVVAENRAFDHFGEMFVELSAGGQPEFCDIWVKPFSVEIEGVTHGLFYEQDEEEPQPGDEQCEWVMLQPCDIMFHPPWDSGQYST
jgi:formate hydrogenlyase regulatory protein HycA